MKKLPMKYTIIFIDVIINAVCALHIGAVKEDRL